MKNFLLFLGMAAGLLLASCSSKIKNTVQEQKFITITPLVRDTVYTNEHVAEINAFQNVALRSRVDGIIESIEVDEGQMVRKGQVLFTINNRQFLQDLQKAKAIVKKVQSALNASEIELKGSKKLLNKDYISQPEYELAVARVDALEAELEEAKSDEAQAQLNLSFAQVKAPFDGFINRIPNKEGSVLEVGALLSTISNNKNVFAYFNVSEIEYLKYAISKDKEETKEVSLILADGTPYPHKGIIETTESEFNNNTGTIAFRAKFPNPANILKHGATGKVQLSNRLEKALLIPQKVTFDRQDELCVFVVDDSNTIQVRKITPSLRLPNLFAVKQGLSPNDKILFEGIQHVKVGDKVNPEVVSLSKIVANL